MKKMTLTAILLVGMIASVFSMDYGTGIGLRGGLSSGLTVKHFIGEGTAIEGLVDFRDKDFNLTLLYEIHNASAFGVSRLNWYYGLGAHVGFWDGNNGNNNDDDNTIVIGVDGILGIEYNFKEFPFNIGLDWKPAFNLVGDTKFWGDGGALSIRYVF